MNPTELITFRILDERNGIHYAEPLPQTYPLEKWFAGICEVPIARFQITDLARACRQRIHPDAVVPYCLRALEILPLAGDYDGQLLLDITELPADYWTEHPDQRTRVVAICTYALREADPGADEDVILKIQEWMSRQLSEIEGHNRHESER